MKPASTLQALYLAWFSGPSHERCLYRALRKRRVRSIAEIGVGDGRRAFRLLSVAQRYRPGERLSYAGIDLFEARTGEAQGMTLKDAHRQFTKTGVQLRLVPGDPFAALARCANALTNTDLLVISADHDPASLDPAWFYVPRMLHENSLVFVEEQNGRSRTYRRLTLKDVVAKQQVLAPSRAA